MCNTCPNLGIFKMSQCWKTNLNECIYINSNCIFNPVLLLTI